MNDITLVQIADKIGECHKQKKIPSKLVVSLRDLTEVLKGHPHHLECVNNTGKLWGLEIVLVYERVPFRVIVRGEDF